MSRIVSDQGQVEAASAQVNGQAASIAEAGQGVSSSFGALAGDGSGALTGRGLEVAAQHNEFTASTQEMANLLTRHSVNNANDTGAIDRNTAAGLGA